MDHLDISGTEHSSVILMPNKVEDILNVVPQKCLIKVKLRGIE